MTTSANTTETYDISVDPKSRAAFESLLMHAEKLAAMKKQAFNLDRLRLVFEEECAAISECADMPPVLLAEVMCLARLRYNRIVLIGDNKDIAYEIKNILGLLEVCLNADAFLIAAITAIEKLEQISVSELSFDQKMLLKEGISIFGCMEARIGYDKILDDPKERIRRSWRSYYKRS